MLRVLVCFADLCGCYVQVFGLVLGAALEFGCGCLWSYSVTFALMVGVGLDGLWV